MTRRDLIQKVLIGGTTILAAPALLESCSKESDPPDNNNNGNKITLDLTVPTYSVLNTAGGSLVYLNLIIANTGSGFVALEKVCTHAGCTVNYDSVAKEFPCLCHGSKFSLTGSVVNGPATVALKQYTVSKSGDILTINL
jgi:cytochrome b6-f complex iron-sulfur subunit